MFNFERVHYKLIATHVNQNKLEAVKVKEKHEMSRHIAEQLPDGVLKKYKMNMDPSKISINHVFSSSKFRDFLAILRKKYPQLQKLNVLKEGLSSSFEPFMKNWDIVRNSPFSKVSVEQFARVLWFGVLALSAPVVSFAGVAPIMQQSLYACFVAAQTFHDRLWTPHMHNMFLAGYSMGESFVNEVSLNDDKKIGADNADIRAIMENVFLGQGRSADEIEAAKVVQGVVNGEYSGISYDSDKKSLRLSYAIDLVDAEKVIKALDILIGAKTGAIVVKRQDDTNETLRKQIVDVIEKAEIIGQIKDLIEKSKLNDVELKSFLESKGVGSLKDLGFSEDAKSTVVDFEKELDAVGAKLRIKLDSLNEKRAVIQSTIGKLMSLRQLVLERAALSHAGHIGRDAADLWALELPFSDDRLESIKGKDGFFKEGFAVKENKKGVSILIIDHWAKKRDFDKLIESVSSMENSDFKKSEFIEKLKIAYKITHKHSVTEVEDVNWLEKDWGKANDLSNIDDRTIFSLAITSNSGVPTGVANAALSTSVFNLSRNPVLFTFELQNDSADGGMRNTAMGELLSTLEQEQRMRVVYKRLNKDKPRFLANLVKNAVEKGKTYSNKSINYIEMLLKISDAKGNIYESGSDAYVLKMALQEYFRSDGISREMMKRYLSEVNVWASDLGLGERLYEGKVIVMNDAQADRLNLDSGEYITLEKALKKAADKHFKINKVQIRISDAQIEEFARVVARHYSVRDKSQILIDNVNTLLMERNLTFDQKLEMSAIISSQYEITDHEALELIDWFVSNVNSIEKEVELQLKVDRGEHGFGNLDFSIVESPEDFMRLIEYSQNLHAKSYGGSLAYIMMGTMGLDRSLNAQGLDDKKILNGLVDAGFIKELDGNYVLAEIVDEDLLDIEQMNSDEKRILLEGLEKVNILKSDGTINNNIELKKPENLVDLLKTYRSTKSEDKNVLSLFASMSEAEISELSDILFVHQEKFKKLSKEKNKVLSDLIKKNQPTIQKKELKEISDKISDWLSMLYVYEDAGKANTWGGVNKYIRQITAQEFARDFSRKKVENLRQSKLARINPLSGDKNSKFGLKKFDNYIVVPQGEDADKVFGEAQLLSDKIVGLVTAAFDDNAGYLRRIKEAKGKKAYLNNFQLYQLEWEKDYEVFLQKIEVLLKDLDPVFRGKIKDRINDAVKESYTWQVDGAKGELMMRVEIARDISNFNEHDFLKVDTQKLDWSRNLINLKDFYKQKDDQYNSHNVNGLDKKNAEDLKEWIKDTLSDLSKFGGDGQRNGFFSHEEVAKSLKEAVSKLLLNQKKNRLSDGVTLRVMDQIKTAGYFGGEEVKDRFGHRQAVLMSAGKLEQELAEFGVNQDNADKMNSVINELVDEAVLLLGYEEELKQSTIEFLINKYNSNREFTIYYVESMMKNNFYLDIDKKNTEKKEYNKYKIDESKLSKILPNMIKFKTLSTVMANRVMNMLEGREFAKEYQQFNDSMEKDKNKSMFGRHRTAGREHGKRKPVIYDSMMLGHTPYEQVKQNIIAMISKHRATNGQVSFQVIWENMKDNYMSNSISTRLDKMVYNGISYDFWDEIDKIAKMMDQDKNSINFMELNSDDVDKRQNNRVLVSNKFIEVIDEKIKSLEANKGNMSKSDYSLQMSYLLNIKNARDTVIGWRKPSFFGQLDRDNITNKYLIDGILMYYGIGADGVNNGKIVNTNLAMIQGAQGFEFDSDNALSIGAVHDMNNAENVMFYAKSANGLTDPQGCGNAINVVDDAFVDVSRSVLDVQPNVSKIKSPRLRQAFALGTALGATVGSNVAANVVLTLMAEAMGLMSFLGTTISVLSFIFASSVFPKVFKAVNENIKAKENTSETKLDVGRFQARTQILGGESSIEDFMMLPSIVTSNKISILLKTEMFSVMPEGALKVLSNQYQRWNGAKLETPETFKYIAKLNNKKISDLMLSQGIFGKRSKELEEESVVANYPNAPLAMYSYAMVGGAYVLAGLSAFNFSTGFFPAILGSSVNIVAFSILGFGSFLLKMGLLRIMSARQGQSKQNEADATVRFMSLCAKLMSASIMQMTSDAKLPFVVTQPQEVPEKVGFEAFFLEKNDIKDFWNVEFSRKKALDVKANAEKAIIAVEMLAEMSEDEVDLMKDSKDLKDKYEALINSRWQKMSKEKMLMSNDEWLKFFFTNTTGDVLKFRKIGEEIIEKSVFSERETFLNSDFFKTLKIEGYIKEEASGHYSINSKKFSSEALDVPKLMKSLKIDEKEAKIVYKKLVAKKNRTLISALDSSAKEKMTLKTAEKRGEKISKQIIKMAKQLPKYGLYTATGWATVSAGMALLSGGFVAASFYFGLTFVLYFFSRRSRMDMYQNIQNLYNKRIQSIPETDGKRPGIDPNIKIEE